MDQRALIAIGGAFYFIKFYGVISVSDMIRLYAMDALANWWNPNGDFAPYARLWEMEHPDHDLYWGQVATLFDQNPTIKGYGFELLAEDDICPMQGMRFDEVFLFDSQDRLLSGDDFEGCFTVHSAENGGTEKNFAISIKGGSIIEDKLAFLRLAVARHFWGSTHSCEWGNILDVPNTSHMCLRRLTENEKLPEVCLGEFPSSGEASLFS